LGVQLHWEVAPRHVAPERRSAAYLGGDAHGARHVDAEDEQGVCGLQPRVAGVQQEEAVGAPEGQTLSPRVPRPAEVAAVDLASRRHNEAQPSRHVVLASLFKYHITSTFTHLQPTPFHDAH